jgi:hypothetical protein
VSFTPKLAPLLDEVVVDKFRAEDEPLVDVDGSGREEVEELVAEVATTDDEEVELGVEEKVGEVVNAKVLDADTLPLEDKLAEIDAVDVAEPPESTNAAAITDTMTMMTTTIAIKRAIAGDFLFVLVLFVAKLQVKKELSVRPLDLSNYFKCWLRA